MYKLITETGAGGQGKFRGSDERPENHSLSQRERMIEECLKKINRMYCQTRNKFCDDGIAACTMAVSKILCEQSLETFHSGKPHSPEATTASAKDENTSCSYSSQNVSKLQPDLNKNITNH